MKFKLSPALLALCLAATAALPAHAAQMFSFEFATTTPLFGSAGAGNGTLTIDGPAFPSRGSTAQTITGITGTFNGSAITGLATPFGANNLFYANGPTFVDGSGLGFITAAGTSVNLFFQSSVNSFRINTINPFTSSFVSASTMAVGGAGGAVPEPASWAMMLVGFGAVGIGLRRRNVLAAAQQLRTVAA